MVDKKNLNETISTYSLGSLNNKNSQKGYSFIFSKKSLLFSLYIFNGLGRVLVAITNFILQLMICMQDKKEGVKDETSCEIPLQ